MEEKLDPYDEQLLDLIAKEEKWLKSDNKDLIISLIKIADKQFESQTVEGILSSVLIYQQVLEEFLRTLLRLSNLYIRGEIWPSKIELEVKERMMFGQLLQEHKRSIDFDCKHDLLRACKDFGEVRNKFVHSLLKFPSNEDMIKEAAIIKQVFHKSLDHYLKGRSFLEWKLLDLRKRLGLT